MIAWKMVTESSARTAAKRALIDLLCGKTQTQTYNILSLFIHNIIYLNFTGAPFTVKEIFIYYQNSNSYLNLGLAVRGTSKIFVCVMF